MDGKLDTKLEKLKSDLLGWTFLFWVTTVGTVILLVKL